MDVEVIGMKRNEVTPVEVARMLGVGRLYVYELLASGRIEGRKVLGRWLLSTKAVEGYRREHPRIGGRRVQVPKRTAIAAGAEA